MPRIQTDDIETYYERHGEGPTMVFSHGAGLDHREWQPQVDAFSGDYEVVTYDVRGHGETPLGSRPELTVDRLVDDLHAIVTGLELDDPIVCGLSMGGMIAHQYAARYPDDIGRLVVAGTQTAEPLLLSERVLRSIFSGGVLRVGEWFGPERAETLLDGINSVMERFVGEDASGHDEELEAIGDNAIDMADYLAVMEALSQGYTPVDLSAITVPTLILFGGKETATTRAHAGKLAAEVPDAGVEQLPDTGHVSNWDSPALFNETIRAFLASNAAIDS